MTRADPVWYRLELLTTKPDLLLSFLHEHGALGVEVQDRDTHMEDGSIPPVPDGQTRLIAFFDEPFSTPLPETAEVVSNASYDDRSWETTWKKYFRPVQVSKRAIVGPPWEEFEAPIDGVRIEIEPGMAFGTGTHETTQLCAAILDDLLAEELPGSLLDVGCGTGVLSMIAAGLGVAEIAGVDIDDTAVEIARENLRRNAMTGRAKFSTTPLPRLGLYDLVVANILAHILQSLHPDLIARVRPGGLLVTSGITVEQADQFEEQFRDPELELVERREHGDWTAFVWRRRE